LTPFERNLEVWRQLWRVLERSQLVVQIVDARNPLRFRCEDLENYVYDVEGAEGERGTGKGKRTTLLLVNKADLLTAEQRCALTFACVSNNAQRNVGSNGRIILMSKRYSMHFSLLRTRQLYNRLDEMQRLRLSVPKMRRKSGKTPHLHRTTTKKMEMETQTQTRKKNRRKMADNPPRVDLNRPFPQRRRTKWRKIPGSKFCPFLNLKIFSQEQHRISLVSFCPFHENTTNTICRSIQEFRRNHTIQTDGGPRWISQRRQVKYHQRFAR